MNWMAIISSCIWLGLVLLIVYAACKEYGIVEFLKNILGAFAYKHFIENEQEGEIRIGFLFFGMSFFYIKLPVEKVASVEWHAGQGTHFAGRDMNDWSVALWYDHDDPKKSEDRKSWKYADQEVHIVGPSGKKEITAALGDSLVLFLNKAGTKLIPSDDECKFIRKS